MSEPVIGPGRSAPGRWAAAANVGIDLVDRETGECEFHINFWHWGAIVGCIEKFQILSRQRIDEMDRQFEPESGLTQDECRLVAAAIRTRVLPDLSVTDRVLLDGSTTSELDDGVFHQPSEGREQYAKNYSTNRAVLEEFASYCERCHGFKVL